MSRAFIHVPPIGIGPNDNFFYDGTRPARHCGICGESYQPALARSPNYLTNKGVQHEVEKLLVGWANYHNYTKHTERAIRQYRERGNLMTPEAALKLIPLGIYPLTDLVMDDEIRQAGLEAKRAPSDDVPTVHIR